MRKGKFAELDNTVLGMLRERPRPARGVARDLGMSKDKAFLIIKRLKQREMAYYHNGRWYECAPQATKDTSIFPRPQHRVPNVGFYW